MRDAPAKTPEASTPKTWPTGEVIGTCSRSWLQSKSAAVRLIVLRAIFSLDSRQSTVLVDRVYLLDAASSAWQRFLLPIMSTR